MLQDCIRIFKKELEKHTDALIVDNYTPKDGTYILIKILDHTFEIGEPLNIWYNRKTDEIEGSTNSDFRFIQQLDYYSKLVEMNKPMDPKKIIHSNNYLTFFVKKESLASNKLTDEIIDGFYQILTDPRVKYDKKPKTLSLYDSVEQKLGKPDESLVNRIHFWIKENIFQLGVDISKKDYLKLFFVFEDTRKTEELYRSEGKRYLLPNIYNNNDFNLISDDEIYGLPNDNIGMNSKKPYLENKNRKIKVPYMLSLEDVLLQSQFFDYLMGKASVGYVNVYIDSNQENIRFYKQTELPKDFEHGYYLRIQKGKEVEIHNMDAISEYHYHLKKKFYYKKILPLSAEAKKTMVSSYGVKRNLQEMQFLIDDVLFSKYLMGNYTNEPGSVSIKDSVLKYNVLIARDVLYAWFFKGETSRLEALLKSVSLNLIINSINKGYLLKAVHQLNLRWSLMDYFSENNEMEEEIVNVRERLKKCIVNKEEWDFLNSDEYYYAVGQLMRYYVSKVKSKKQELSILNPLLNAGNDKVLKKHLMQMFQRVNHAIELSDYRVLDLIAHVEAYETSEKINKDMILGGFAASLLIYEKKEA